ncbi:MAG: potassium channel family protein [Candidatus Krumholzibacteriia bacterium]
MTVLLGVALLLVVLYDALKTTLGTMGGPLTRRLAGGLWRLGLGLHRRRSSHGLLSTMGVITVLATIGMWVTLLWTAWYLIFTGGTNAVVADRTSLPADVSDRIYFTGFTIFTLGVGDYVPEGAVWQVVTPAASLCGLFLVTLAITYLTPLMEAVARKRRVAAHIHALGSSPAEIVTGAWDGRSCRALTAHLDMLLPDLGKLQQDHLAYPVLGYFHAGDRRQSVALGLASLDEALSVLEFGVEPGVCLSPQDCRPIRRTMGHLLGTLESAYFRPAEHPPPVPDLELLREQGIPVVAAARFEARLERIAERRRLLRALVEHDGWDWGTPAEPRIAAE